jgi:hypothetical protein
LSFISRSIPSAPRQAQGQGARLDIGRIIEAGRSLGLLEQVLTEQHGLARLGRVEGDDVGQGPGLHLRRVGRSQIGVQIVLQLIEQHLNLRRAQGPPVRPLGQVDQDRACVAQGLKVLLEHRLGLG